MTKHDDPALKPAPASVKEPEHYDIAWLRRHVADPKDGEAKERAAETLRRCGPLAVAGVLYEYDPKSDAPIRSDQKRTDQAVDDDEGKKAGRRTIGVKANE